jgi:hypothetical protein
MTLFYLLSKKCFSIPGKIFITSGFLCDPCCSYSIFFFLAKATGKISSIMVPKISERKLPLVIQCFLLIILLKQSITVERYPELHFFYAALMSTLIAWYYYFSRLKPAYTWSA